MTDWQPIETAPKDGTNIIVSNGQAVAQGWWCDEPGYIREHRDLDGHYIDQDESDGFTGWMDCDGGMQPDATHWQLLPPPPGVRVCDEGECRAAERDSIICAGECDVAAGRRPDGVAPTDPVPSLESSVKLPLHQAVQWNGAVQCAEREPHKPVVLDGRTVLAVHAKLAAGVPECVNHQQENGK